MNIKHCPFCGFKPDLNNPDTIYPSGIFWREASGMTVYVNHSNRLPEDHKCWMINCVEVSGGCGAQVFGHSKEQVIDKWNMRSKPKG